MLLGLLLSALLVILASCLALVYQLTRQHGRLLLRLEALEKEVGLDEPRLGHTHGDSPTGLPVGSAFPPFALPDLDDHIVRLGDLKGRRVLLVHWSPECGFCELIAPDLAELQEPLSRQDIQLVLVSSGSREANRALAGEQGLRCPILVHHGSTPIQGFRDLGTPVAYLLDEEGRIAQPLAVGAEAVPILAGEGVAGSNRRSLPGEKPLAESRMERNGLLAGTQAPLFDLPDINGHAVSLQSFRGRRVLLVFSDPHCGPCDELAPHLARLYRKHSRNGLAVLMVGRGDRDANRQKANQYKFDFPVALQQRWEISKQYGIFSTPVGFLIGPDGVIARDVARGKDAILTLLS
jgi:peroxiredoxin